MSVLLLVPAIVAEGRFHIVVSLGCVILGLLKVSDVSSLVCCKSRMRHPWFFCKSRMRHPWFVVSLGCVILGLF